MIDARQRYLEFLVRAGMPWWRGVWLWSLIGLVGLFMGLTARAQATVPTSVTLSGSIREVPAVPASGVRKVHRPFVSRTTLTTAETDASLGFEVALKMRNLPELQARVARGEKVAFSEMADKYNPSTADYEKVISWLSGEGFKITRTDKNHLAVFALGKVSRIRDSLQVNFARVTVDGTEYTSAVTAPSAPAALALLLVGINGLQPHLKMHKHLVLRPKSLTGTDEPYLPSQIAKAYNADTLYSSGITGSGQTIAIVIDTFPATSDLTSFWSTYHVAQSITNIGFIQVVPGTLPAPSGEETLDTEWASSMAPGAKVRVYAAQALDYDKLDEVYQQIYSDVSSHPEYEIHQMSMSYGTGEEYTPQSEMDADTQYYAEIASAGVTICNSSGDDGSTPGPNGVGDESGDVQAQYPASDPSVTGVGGTSLTLDSQGVASSENVWNDEDGASGGGISMNFNRPSWQTGTGVPGGTARLVPDVACSADPENGGVVIFQGSQIVYGGTSWSCPTWAGFCALINQDRANAGKASIGLLGPAIYPLIGSGAFRDITFGNSATDYSNGVYVAGTGYDLCTGIGVPDMQVLAQTLQNYPYSAPKAPYFTSGVPATSLVNGSAYSFTFAAGGSPPPTFSVTSGTLPSGLRLSSNGLFSGTPSQSGTFTATVTAANGVNPAASVTFTIDVHAAPSRPTITNGPPPTSAITTLAYSFTYDSPSYPVPTFSVTAGQLPPGLTLTSAGVLSGKPTEAGTFSGIVTATNGISPNTIQRFIITVQEAAAPVITNGPPPSGTLNSAYSFTYKVSGTPTPTFSLVSGNLPPGLTLSSAGVLSGTPTATGTFTGVVGAANGIGSSVTQSFSIAVRQAPVLTNAALIMGVKLNTAFSFALTGVGYPVPTFSLTSGALPPGLGLSSSGILSGTVTQAGTYTGTITATNSVGSASENFTITVQSSLALTLVLPTAMNEGDPDGVGMVSLNAISSSNVTVQLASSNHGALTLPASVVIPAGSRSVSFAYTIIDNLNVYGTQTSRVTASASGWAGINEVVSVTDNKTTDNWSSYGNGQAHTGFYPGPLLGGTYNLAWYASFPSVATAINPVAIAKGIVYATPITYEGISDLTALRAADGTQLWQHVYSASGLSGTAYFSIDPPTVYKGNVYVEQGDGSNAANGQISPALGSFNAASGVANWTVDLATLSERYLAPTAYQSIGIWTGGGVEGGVAAVNFNGSLLSFTDEAEVDQWTPTYYNGTIYTWLANPEFGSNLGTFTAINPASGAVIWSATEPAVNASYDINCAAPIADNQAYLNGNTMLTAINLTSHAVAWQITGSFFGTPAASNGKVYVLSGSAVEILNATTGAVLSTIQTDGAALIGQPVVATDSLIVSSPGKTFIYSLATNALVQAIPYGGPVTVAGGALYIAGSAGTLRVYRSDTPTFNFAANGAVGLASYGYTATGQTLAASLGFVPTAGTVLTVIDNTGPSAISGTFSNLPNRGTIDLTYNGHAYAFTANYAGGDGNDLTLAYTPVPTVITSATSATFQAGQPNSFNVTATGASPFIFSATGLPAWATLNASTGVLSGTPPNTTGSPFTLHLTVSSSTTATATQTFTLNVQPIVMVAQTISFTTIGNQVYGASPITLHATASSGLPVSFKTGGPISISNGVMTITGTGSAVVDANQAGNIYYDAAPEVRQTFTITPELQTITFPIIHTQTYGAAPLALNAKSSSGLGVTYRIVSGPASVSGSALTITGAGSVTVGADQAGNADYAAATEVTNTFTVEKSHQTLVFPAIANLTYKSAPITLTATASSGLPITYSSTGPVSISGHTLTTTGPGAATVKALQAGNANYDAVSATDSFTVYATQTVTFPSPGTLTYGEAPVMLHATASSGLPVTYTATGPVSVSGSTLTLTGGGTATVTASQAGNADYQSAGLTDDFTINPASQVIIFPAIGNQVYGSVPITLRATASSGLPISYRTSGPVTVSGQKLTMTGTGSVVIGATQAGNASYTSAAEVRQTFTITAADASKAAVAAASPFEQWEALHGATTTAVQPDGISPLLKYLCGIDPTRPVSAADRAALPTVGVASLGGDSYLTLTYRQFAGENGVTVAVQTSTDLQTWTEVRPEIDHQTAIDPETADPMVEVGVKVTGLKTKFIRLKISTFVSGEEIFATTIPEAYMTFDFAATAAERSKAYFSLPLTADPVYQGAVSSVTSRAIRSEGAAWKNGELAGKGVPYFVKFLSGAQTGRVVQVMANSANLLTLDTGDNGMEEISLTTSGFSVRAGDTFEVFEGETLASLLGDNPTESPFKGTGDVIEIYDPISSSWKSYSFDPTAGFWTAHGSSARADGTVLAPYAALRVVRGVHEAAVSFAWIGRVAEVAALTRASGSGITTYVSTACAVGLTLAQIHPGANWVTGDRTGEADNLLLWDAASDRFNTYFQRSDSTWRISGDNATDQSGVTIPAGSVISVLRHGSVNGSNSFLQWILPYSLN